MGTSMAPPRAQTNTRTIITKATKDMRTGRGTNTTTRTTTPRWLPWLTFLAAIPFVHLAAAYSQTVFLMVFLFVVGLAVVFAEVGLRGRHPGGNDCRKTRRW